ncbi:FAD:protein FMN transferase [Clostridium folliculivorans]|uniref:FAD:protein FMN transferase n=1 Tax=Clostridium folliculivorans TaxID=2886038 RepID=A0A9W5Y5M1_9CLOT|nr:FAD:protein FMN transferase [Clostridium folliculivorans]GKU26990.1 FAD:protein FMN transferase [Clostridium folliculivorans]GKU29168.1 FAD:protein FMN transferase [Clostridium folliculivorans]
MIKKILAIGLSLFLIIPMVSCSKKDEKVDKYATKMDTIMHLTAYGPNASEAIDEAFKRVDEIEKIASSSIETSDVNKINEAAGKEYVKVHPEIVKIIKTSIEYSKISNGAFDITVSPLIKLWGIGTDQERVPADSEIKDKLALVGYKNISINESDNSVKLMKAGMAIDLGGVAKGFTADEIVKVFKKYGVNSAIINLGGSSIYTLGVKPDKTQWSVAIQNPRKEKNEGNIGIVKLNQGALSTSGDYQRFFIKDGKRYHHILDPFTGYPADAGVMSDTILIDSSIADCNMLADILTKVTFVSGVDKGMKIIDSIKGISCMAVTTDFKIYKSSKWDTKIEELSPDFKMAN